MNRIYTKTGDTGTTGIHGGERVPKDDIRIEANGCIDELNSLLGVVRANLEQSHPWQDTLHILQIRLMAIMSHVATPSSKRDINPNILPPDLVAMCEKVMDELSSQMEDGRHFILPGGTLVSANLHLARSVCRKAERRLWTLNREDELPQIILQFFNRLSDLLFVMARYDMWQQGWTEERWQAFAYKNSRKNG